MIFTAGGDGTGVRHPTFPGERFAMAYCPGTAAALARHTGRPRYCLHQLFPLLDIIIMTSLEECFLFVLIWCHMDGLGLAWIESLCILMQNKRLQINSFFFSSSSSSSSSSSFFIETIFGQNQNPTVVQTRRMLCGQEKVVKKLQTSCLTKQLRPVRQPEWGGKRVCDQTDCCRDQFGWLHQEVYNTWARGTDCPDHGRQLLEFLPINPSEPVKGVHPY